GEPALVGFDGAVYLESLEPRNTLDVQTPGGGRCRASFDYRKDGAGIPQIGPLRCIREAKTP
ncbi:MAG TPA: FimD/PapC C-terminal domain-containing protein, partial [Variovorax sp.]|nr:FimD/PapC C-terminal domain-containing protein [Variovorax sp.]